VALIHRLSGKLSMKIAALIMIICGMGGAALAPSAPALAATARIARFGPSYCNSTTCDLAAQPYWGYIYFEMPRLTPLTMICWTDTQWFDGSNRWFKASSIYGIGYTPANEVGNQTRVGHC
jgi:hypothetical protein